MKKNFLKVLSILILSSSIGIAYSKTVSNTDLANAIKLYKDGNYSECYIKLESVIKDDPANAIAYYYMAMTSAQIGKKDEAISNYDKAINLVPGNNNLSMYAKKGKRCLETPDRCEDSLFDSLEDEFVRGKFGAKFSQDVQSDFERLKIENIMREMNRNDSMESTQFEGFKDFSGVPTNDEIVAAMRVLQRAGFSNPVNNGYSDLAVLTGSGQNNTMLNMLGSQSMNPQLIQALLTNNMTQGF